MRNLAQRVDAGIGAARAGYRYSRTGQFFDRSLKRSLYRGTIVLTLPADKGRAVVFQGQPVAHQEKRVPTGRPKPFNSSRPCITPLPARCTVMSFSAPSPQPTVKSSVMTSPGSPQSLIGTAYRTFSRPPFTSVKAAGEGESPRIKQSSSAALLVQSMRASPLEILRAE